MKRCYFAYTWDDDDTELPRLLGILKEMIEEHSEGEIEVIYDKESFKTGENFKEKENLIYVSDCIIIFFSPNYRKNVTVEDEDKGAYREYKKIKDVKSKGIASILPVIVRGNKKDSITEEFDSNIADIFDIADIFTKGDKKIRQIYFQRINGLVRKIIKETNVAYKKRDREFATIDDKMEALFGEAASNEELPHDCMYESDAYISVLNQNRRYIIGRKGSGKTTFFELLEKYDVDAFNNKFKVLRPIDAEQINMEYAYNIINAFKQDEKLFSMNTRLELFWQIYTYLCAIYIVCLEEELCNVPDLKRSKVFKEAGDVFRYEKLNVEKLHTDKCHEALFISAIESFDEFFKSQLVGYSHDKSYIASLVANFNVENVMKSYFGETLYKKLKSAILKCKKKVMIALDGFDRVSEDFRKTTIHLLNSKDEVKIKESENRLEFESLFYRSMFNVFEKLRKAKSGIISKVAFCIIMPQDRLDQIKIDDRDFSKFNFATLSWDAVDLMKMLVKRLEYVYGKLDEDDVLEKFNFIMKKYFKYIPLKIHIKIDGKDFYMPLYEYLLRISFWRPRDIIKYFYEIYLANKNNIGANEVLSSDTIKSVLYSKADDIIEQEFYAEYKTVITNIEDIMECFRGNNIYLELDDVYEILSKQPFKTSALREFNIPYNKLKMLYELSVLGIWVDRNTKTKLNLSNQLCFNYNEGIAPIEILKGNRSFGSEELKIVINPIFSKKLSLIYNTKDVLEDYGWKYFSENHARKSSIKRI